MAKRKTQFKVSYYIATRHFLVKEEDELNNITTMLETAYNIEVTHEIKWTKGKDKHGTQIDFYLLSDTHTKLQLSEAVESLHKKILGTSFKKYIELIRDESSVFLSQKLFVDIYNIEVGLRSILKKILISVFGADWKKKIFDDNFRTKSREDKLESLTLSELYHIMFVNRRFLPSYKNDELNAKTKEDLITIINNIQTLTFWERFFPNIKLKEKVGDLKKYRNMVMHFKGVTHTDYKNCKKLCTQITPLIEKANSELEMESMVSLLADAFKKIDFLAIKSALLSIATEINKMVLGFYEGSKKPID